MYSRGQNPSLEPVRNCNNNNSSPLHAVGLAAITQLVRQEPSPGRMPAASPLRPTAEFPGVLPTDVVVELPSPTHERERNSRYLYDYFIMLAFWPMENKVECRDQGGRRTQMGAVRKSLLIIK